jgi:hypothetical protein
MLLKDAVVQIQNDRNWAVYATDTNPDAEARYGQRQFENGGVLDDKRFIIDGEIATRALLAYTDNDPYWLDEHGDREEFFQFLVDEGYVE